MRCPRLHLNGLVPSMFVHMVTRSMCSLKANTSKDLNADQLRFLLEQPLLLHRLLLELCELVWVVPCWDARLLPLQ